MSQNRFGTSESDWRSRSVLRDSWARRTCPERTLQDPLAAETIAPCRSQEENFAEKLKELLRLAKQSAEHWDRAPPTWCEAQQLLPSSCRGRHARGRRTPASAARQSRLVRCSSRERRDSERSCRGPPRRNRDPGWAG